MGRLDVVIIGIQDFTDVAKRKGIVPRNFYGSHMTFFEHLEVLDDKHRRRLVEDLEVCVISHTHRIFSLQKV